MHALFAFALERHAGSVHLGQAVGIIDVKAEALLDLLAGFLRVGFRARRTPCATRGRGADPLPSSPEISQVQRIAGRQMDKRRPEILHQHHLSFRVARPGGHEQPPSFRRRSG